MKLARALFSAFLALGATAALSGCGSMSGSSGSTAFQVTVSRSGSGSGVVSSAPTGISCGSTCSAMFTSGTTVQLAATPAQGSVFKGWGGACSGTGICSVTVDAATAVTATFDLATPPPNYTLAVSLLGSGTGTVTSTPAGINCGTACSAMFAAGTSITLTATPTAGYAFSGWSSPCSGTGACTITIENSITVSATFSKTLQSSINHIIVMAQENRSFDSYFGAMHQYWLANGYTDQDFDGLPQFNNPAGPAPTNPGCDPAELDDCVFDANSPLIESYQFQTVCVENPSPSWNESHVDWNLTDPVDPVATLDGFVHTAGHDARNMVPPFFDINGIRAMGYYTGDQLNYYYFMASNFATSDRWFSPMMSRTPPNREYMYAATSQGHVYTLKGNDSLLTAKTIFEELQDAGITWKIYVHPDGNGCSTTQCLYKQSYIQNFVFGPIVRDQYPQNLATTDQFIADAQAGALPQFAFIEPPSAVGLDEHPSDGDPPPGQPPCCSVEAGANFVSSLVGAVMNGPSWQDSAFLFTYDEFGGFYDHVAPQPAVSPDGIPPSDLLPGDVCTEKTGPTCDFTYTGYRIPLIVISPYSKQHYVSHAVADSTAILKLVETRFGLAALTARDAAQLDMSQEFFDFVTPPWIVPPTPPTQVRTGQCYLDHLP